MSSTIFDAIARLGFQGALQAQVDAENESERQFSSVDVAKIIPATDEELNELASLQRKKRNTERKKHRQYTKAKKAASQKGATPNKITKSYAVTTGLSSETAVKIAEASLVAEESTYKQNQFIIGEINKLRLYGRADQYELAEMREAAYKQTREHRAEAKRVIVEEIDILAKELAEREAELAAQKTELVARAAALAALEAELEAEEFQPEPAPFQLGGLAFRPR